MTNEEELKIHNKLDILLEMQKENSGKIDALFRCIYVGNGEPPLKIAVDRNRQSVKLILWALGGFYTLFIGFIAVSIFG